MYKLIAIAGLFTSLLFTMGEARAQSFEDCDPATDTCTQNKGTITITNDEAIELGAGDNIINNGFLSASETVAGTINIGQNGGSLLPGPGDDVINNGFIRAGTGGGADVIAKGIINIYDLLDLCAGHDVLNNEKGSEINFLSGTYSGATGKLLFGTEDDVLNNRGTITFNNDGAVIDFGTGNDRLINAESGVISIVVGTASIINGVVENAGVISLLADSTLVLSEYTETGTGNVKIKYGSTPTLDIKKATDSLTLDIDFTGVTPSGTSHTLIALSNNPLKNVKILAADVTTLGLTNPQIVSLLTKNADNTFSHQLVAREDPTALPAIGYDIATKAVIDCDTILACKGINTAIDTSSATNFDSASITLDANGFAVDGGYAYFARSNPLLTLATAVDSKVQIHGLVYVGDVSTPATPGTGNNPVTTYPLTIASGGDFAFAAISGGGNFELTNYGAIIGSGDALISLTELASGKIYNEGSISAAKAAIKIDDTSGAETYQITNKGSIGSDGEAILAKGGVITIDNSGGIGSSIELVADAQGGDGKHATIHIGEDATADANAVTIINRKGGKIRYRIGSLDGSTTPDSTPVYVASLSALKIYNAGDIIVSKGANAKAGIKGYAIFWNGNDGSISNTGRIIGLDSAIHVVGSTARAVSDIVIHNNGLIKSNGQTINIEGAAHKVSIFNYEGGTISTAGTAEAIRANQYGEFYLTNHGLIIGGGATTLFMGANTASGTEIVAHNNVIYNTGRIVNTKAEVGRAIKWTGSGFLYNLGTDALISGAKEAIWIDKGLSSNAGREVFTLINSGRIFSEKGHGVRMAAATNTSLRVENYGVIQGALNGIFVYVDTKTHSPVNAKVDILNRAGGGIYGDQYAIYVFSLGADTTKNTAGEKLVIHNDGDIFSKDIAINILEIIGALDITNGPNGAIVAKTNELYREVEGEAYKELDRDVYDDTIAINIDNADSGQHSSYVSRRGHVAPGSYLITNRGRILSNGIAYRDLGSGHLLNTGFILGDIIIAGNKVTLMNLADPNNDFNKDLFGKVGDRSYSFLIDPSKVASGVIVGDIYFYDKDVGEAGSDNHEQRLTNSGIIYGDIYFGKGGSDRYNHHGNARVEGTVSLGAGADFLIVHNGGTMYLNVSRDPSVVGDKFIFDSDDEISVNGGGTLVMNINGPGTALNAKKLSIGQGGKLYIGNLSLRDFIIDAEKPLLDFGSTGLSAAGSTTIGVAFKFDEYFLTLAKLWERFGEVGTKIELIKVRGGSSSFAVTGISFIRPVIMDIDFEKDIPNKTIFATYNGLDFTNAGSLPGAPEDASKFADYLERLLQAEELVSLPAGERLISSLVQVSDLGTYIARLEEALGTANYDSLLSDLSEINAVSSFVDDFTSANCAVRDKAYQSLVVRHEESGCSWTSFTERAVGNRDEQAITSGRQSPLGDNWVSMVAGQYKKVELVDRVEGHARDSETYLLGAGLRSRAPIANVADVSVSLTMGRGEHRRNREWASVQQASMPEMNFQMVRIGASRSFALPLRGSWKITPSTDYNLVRVGVSDLQHEAVSGESVFAIDDMEHNRQSVRVGLELRGEHESERGANITAFARIGVEHYINGRSAGYTIRLVGASEGFSYYGRPIDENVLTTSFGITKARGKAVSFRAFYEGKQGIGGIYENHEAKLELLKRF